ncbi:glucose-1-phosphate adenylyltransferase [compost metagenome]
MKIGEGSIVKNSVIMPGVTIGRHAYIEGAIIGEGSILGDGVEVIGDYNEGIAVIGDHKRIASTEVPYKQRFFPSAHAYDLTY